MGIALVVVGAHAHSPRWPADYCYDDNVLRELEDPNHSASAFCSSFLATTSVPLPTYLTQYSTTTERISSGCSCFFKTTTTNPTSTTSTSSTSGTSPSKSSPTTPGSPTCTEGATVTVTDATTATITQTNTVSSCTVSSCTESATEGTITVTNTVSSCTATTAGTTVTTTDTVTAISTATSTCPAASTVTVTNTVTNTVTSPPTTTATCPAASTVTITDVTTTTAPASTCPSPSTLTITTTNSPSTCVPTTASVTVTQPCTSTSATCVLGKEDLVNGGFENGLAPWALQTALPNVGLTSVTTPSDPTVAHSGSGYLRLDFLNDKTGNETGSNALIIQPITLPSPNSWYRVTGYAKSDTPLSQFTICIDVELCGTAFLNTVWTPVSFTILSSTEMADLQVVVRLQFFTQSDAPIGTSYIDVDDLTVHCTDSDVGL